MTRFLVPVLGLVLLASSACWGGGAGTDYPPAGEDAFDSVQATLEIVFNDGSESDPIELEGRAVVVRLKPRIDEADDLAFIAMEVTELELMGSSDLGAVSVGLSPDRKSIGEVRQLSVGDDFPADSYFQLFLDIQIEEQGFSARNQNQMPVLATEDTGNPISAVPPAADERYDSAEDFVVPMFDETAEQAGSIEAFTITLGPGTTIVQATPESSE